MDELMEQYKEKFGENFPLMYVCLTDEELKKQIKNVLKITSRSKRTTKLFIDKHLVCS